MGHGIGANRGALPCHVLANIPPAGVRVLVPLGPGEALWIGWMLQAGIAVAAHTADNERVGLTEVAKSSDWTLISADSIDAKDGPRPIDATSCVLATEPEGAERDCLIFEITGHGTNKPEHLGIVLGTGELYALLSGLPQPGTTSPSEAYGGWRLP